MFFHWVSGKVEVTCKTKQYSLKGQGPALKMNQAEKLVFNEGVTKYSSDCNTLQNFGLHPNFEALIGFSIDVHKHLDSFHELL